MKTIEFHNKVKIIINQDNRYPADSYVFINNAITHTIQSKTKKDKKQHISAKELLDGIAKSAIENFGPMAYSVLNEWGINDGEAIGNIVFNMVKNKILTTNENDTIEDFKNNKTTLLKPFHQRTSIYAKHLPIIA
jgi:uncharacterized repeat protein (TIGR04138 family)